MKKGRKILNIRIWEEGKGEKRGEYGRKGRERREKNMGGREGEEIRIWEEGKGEKREEYGRKGRGRRDKNMGGREGGREKIMRGWKGNMVGLEAPSNSMMLKVNPCFTFGVFRD